MVKCLLLCVIEHVDCKSLLLVLPQDGWTPLHAACQEGHNQVAELLLEAGASVEHEIAVRWGVGQVYAFCLEFNVGLTLSELNGNLLFMTTEYVMVIDTKRKAVSFLQATKPRHTGVFQNWVCDVEQCMYTIM